MLLFTCILTVCISTVMLKWVFFGVHFYIGVVLCLYILYLLLSLGFSNPGFAFQEYEQMQQHFDLETCTDKCRHADTLNL